MRRVATASLNVVSIQVKKIRRIITATPIPGSTIVSCAAYQSELMEFIDRFLRFGSKRAVNWTAPRACSLDQNDGRPAATTKNGAAAPAP